MRCSTLTKFVASQHNKSIGVIKMSEQNTKIDYDNRYQLIADAVRRIQKR